VATNHPLKRVRGTHTDHTATILLKSDTTRSKNPKILLESGDVGISNAALTSTPTIRSAAV